MVRNILQRYGIRGGHHDQHFLVHEPTLDAIADAARLSPEDTVLEIGGGIGNLTQRLLAKAGHVIVVEMDPELVGVLKHRFKDCENLEIIEGDILKTHLPPFNKIVANLPYSISSPLTFKLFEHDFELAILMYQYEFAARMVAEKGSKDYSRLTVNTRYFADASIIMKVPPSFFEPRPEVWSAVVRLVPGPAPFTVQDKQLFFDLVNAAFLQRRKKIRNSILKGGHMLKVKNLKDMVNELPQDKLDLRPEQLSPGELAELANLIHELKKQQ